MRWNGHFLTNSIDDKSKAIMMPVSMTTQKHLCAFLLSPHRASGLRGYKREHHLQFPEPTKQVSNRLEYFKRLQRDSPTKFSQALRILGVDAPNPPPTALYMPPPGAPNPPLSTKIDKERDSKSSSTKFAHIFNHHGVVVSTQIGTEEDSMDTEYSSKVDIECLTDKTITIKVTVSIN